ncbi:hypothetical protein [Deinococcus aquaedulcis]|uniref:hypothetical protein n=1 Tax=Deinococcus aquaedulcis TaxID=2840455 RepID=UPI001C832E37|nr:hypothetical protein [Deinococcus aquaedulcis]
MPESAPAAIPPLNHAVAVPQNDAIYAGLSTDHYPWTEVTADLTLRQTQGFTGVFDAWQKGRWVRFVWTRGALMGGFTHGGQPVPWAVAMQGVPRARVSLAALPVNLAEVLWATRAAPGQAARTAWPALKGELERDCFHGLLVSGLSCSFWSYGRYLGGALPEPGAPCLLYATDAEANRAQFVQFWQDLLAAIHRVTPLDGAWQQITVRLAGEHPCLDPFAQDISFRGGQLTIEDEVPVREFRPALNAALRAVLTRLGVRLADVPLGALRERPEWAASGLEVS